MEKAVIGKTISSQKKKIRNLKKLRCEKCRGRCNQHRHWRSKRVPKPRKRHEKKKVANPERRGHTLLNQPGKMKRKKRGSKHRRGKKKRSLVGQRGRSREEFRGSGNPSPRKLGPRDKRQTAACGPSPPRSPMPPRRPALRLFTKAEPFCNAFVSGLLLMGC